MLAYLIGVITGCTGMGLVCWLLDAMSKEDEDVYDQD